MKRLGFILACCLFLVATRSQALVTSWIKSYDGPGNAFDIPAAIATFTNGNIYVTGMSDVDSFHADYATIAYTNSGKAIWTNRYSGPAYEDAATALAVSTNGDIYVTGWSETSTTNPYNRDIVTIAYANNGSVKWSARYDGPYHTDDQPVAIRVDTNGNVFVAGWCSTSNSNECDFATIKYSGTGLPLWTNRFHGANHGADRASAMALDRNGNIFVTGFSYGGAAGNNMATIAYSNNGAVLWTNYFAGPGSDQDEAIAIAVDVNGKVFITGFAGPSLKSGADALTFGYSNSGQPLWTNRFTRLAPGGKIVRAIAVDAPGTVFVAGSSYNGSNNDFFTIAYSNGGLPLWTNRYNGLANKDESVNALVVNAAGLVYVTGAASDANTSDFVTIAYSNSGVPVWTNLYDGSDYDVPYAMALDGRGNLYVTGKVHGTPFGFDYATIKYAPPVVFPLMCRTAGSEMVFTWVGVASALQAGPTPFGPFTNVPAATSPYTNACTNAQMFFRLQAY